MSTWSLCAYIPALHLTSSARVAYCHLRTMCAPPGIKDRVIQGMVSKCWCRVVLEGRLWCSLISCFPFSSHRETRTSYPSLQHMGPAGYSSRVPHAAAFNCAELCPGAEGWGDTSEGLAAAAGAGQGKFGVPQPPGLLCDGLALGSDLFLSVAGPGWV